MDPIQACGFSLSDLLARASNAPRGVVIDGWRGYTMVAFKPVSGHRVWGVASAACVCPENANARFRYDTAMYLTHRELMRQAPEDIRSRWQCCVTDRRPVEDYSGVRGRNDESPFYETAAGDARSGWGCMRAWLKPRNDGAELAVVYILPDLVWGTIFPGIRGPLVAIVQSTPSAGERRVHRVCLGAAAWMHLDAATAAFRDRLCIPAPTPPIDPPPSHPAPQATALEYDRAFAVFAPRPSAPPCNDPPPLPSLDGIL
jgi:hypothetical protein